MDHIEIVQKMQDYIKEHVTDHDFHIGQVCEDVRYSRRHADRMFKELTGKTIQEYVNAVCLSNSVSELVKTKKNVLDVALSSHFKTHEGFTRSFSKRFHISPTEYRKDPIPIPLFVQYPVSHYEALRKQKEEENMSSELSLCMITPQERPKRKLIYLPSRKGEDYMSYCEEMGCEWEGLLNSIAEKFDMAALIELQQSLVKDGFSNIAAGVEVPETFQKPLPEGYKIVELPECIMLYFQSEPYEKEEDFCIAIESTYSAIGKYRPESYGYQFAYDLAPSFNFGAEAAMGAKLAVPVRKM